MMKRTVAAMLLVMLVGLLTGSASEAAPKAILLAEGQAISDSLTPALAGFLELPDYGIEADYAGKRFVTEEGTGLGFAAVFGVPLRGSPALNNLRVQHPDANYLVTAFTENDEPRLNPAYQINSYNLKLRVVVTNLATGAVVAEITANGTGMHRDAAEAYAQAVRKAVRALPMSDLKGKIEADAARAPRDRKIRVVMANLTQDEYFAKRDDFFATLRDAGAEEAAWDDYDRAGSTVTLRCYYRRGTFDDFHRTIYHTLARNRLFDRYDVEQTSEGVVTVTKLPPSMKKVVITNVGGTVYHERVSALRDIVNAMPGTANFSYRFVAGNGPDDNMLVFLFSSEKDIAALEHDLWSKIRNDRALTDLELLDYTETVIRYRSGYETGDVSHLQVVVNNISPGNYRAIGSELRGLITTLEVAGLREQYLADQFKLVFDFKGTLSPVELNTLLWQKISARGDALKNIAQDYTSGQTVSFLYVQETSTARQIRIVVRNLAPAEYRDQGQKFVAILRGIGGISDPRPGYSEAEKILTVTCKFDGSDLYAVDEAVWARAKGEPAFARLAMGSIGESELTYFFTTTDSGTSELAAVIHVKRVGGQDYTRVATAFSRLLNTIAGTRDASYAYDYRARTVTFRLYWNQGIFELDDAIARKLAGSDDLKFTARAESYQNCIVYHYYDRQMAGVPVAAGGTDRPLGVPVDPAAAGDIPGLIAAADPAVVTVQFYNGTGHGHGSGFIVTENGYVITNYHVIKEAAELRIKTYDENYYPAQVIHVLPDLDLALLKIKSSRTSFPFLEVGNSSEVVKGQRVIVIGTPLREDLEHSAVTGEISGLDRAGSGLFQISAPIYSGNSGGPVLDLNGRVIGVVVAVDADFAQRIVLTGAQNTVLTIQDVKENLGFCIPANYTRPLLDLAR